MKTGIIKRLQAVISEKKNSLVSAVMLSFVLVALSACFEDRPPFGADVCIAADDWGNKQASKRI